MEADEPFYNPPSCLWPQLYVQLFDYCVAINEIEIEY